MIDNLSIDGTIPMPVFCNHVTSRHHNSPLHVHPHHIEMLLLLSGNASFYTEKQAFLLLPRTLVLVPNGVWHCILTHDDTPYERVYINIELNLIHQLSTTCTNLLKCFDRARHQEVGTMALNEQESTRFTSLCDNLVDVIDQQHDAADIYQRILLTEILLLGNQVAPVPQHRENQMPQLFSKIMQYIAENIAGDLRLSALSHHFYLNPNYIDKYFKSQMNISIHTYVIEKRIELAKQLLGGGESVGETSVHCGFRNYSSFIRTFKQHVGQSPGKYKQTHQRKTPLS